MTTIALKKEYEKVGNLTHKLGMPFEKQNATALINLIRLSTTKSSLDDAKKLHESLLKIKEDILDIKAVDTQVLKEKLRGINGNLLNVNSLFDFIKRIFDLDGNKGAKIEIDEPIMLDFLCEMEQARKLLGYISNYLTLAIETNDLSSGKKISYSGDEIFRLLNKVV